MLTVEKIGGTSMSDFGQVLKNIFLNRPVGNGRIIVVSAYSGITDQLLEHKKSGKPGVYTLFAAGENYRDALAELNFKMQEINAGLRKTGLNQQLADHFISHRIAAVRKHLDGMTEVINSGYADRKIILQAGREMLASLGEVHSAFNSCQILKNHNIPVEMADLSGFGDDEILTIDQRIQKIITPENCKNKITVATGYTRGSEGIMTSFDRGYSEVTFSRIAVLLQADEAIIHKEFHLSSADPGLVGVSKTKPVGRISYEIAGHLASLGMEAIHPRCAGFLSDAGINLRVKNTFEPDHPGTIITEENICSGNGVQIISGCNQAFRLEISTISGLTESRDPETIFNDINSKYKIVTISKNNTAGTFTAVMPARQLPEPFLQELAQCNCISSSQQVAVVNLLGNSLDTGDITSSTTVILNKYGIAPDYLALSLRKKSLQLLVKPSEYDQTIKVLHRHFCE